MRATNSFEIYFDFDNTVTDFDVLDDIIQRFSVDEEWRQIEDAWEDGKIGSRECLEQQLKKVRISEDRLFSYLREVRIDPAFRPILDLLQERQIEPMIVSDSFVLIISKILENNGVPGLKILANEMRLEVDRPVVEFPYFNSICSTCANCKTSHLFRRNRAPGTKKIYVGDGRSDICPSGFCEILFAKGTLYDHYASSHKDCRPFENLSTVYTSLTQLLK